MENPRRLQDFDMNEVMDERATKAMANARAPYPYLINMYLPRPFMVNQLLRPSFDNFEDLAEFTRIMKDYVTLDIIQQVWLGVANLKNEMFTISSLGVDYASFIFYFFSMYFYMKEKMEDNFKESEMSIIIEKYDKKMSKYVKPIMEKLILYRQIREAEIIIMKEKIEPVEEVKVKEIVKEEPIEVGILNNQIYTCKLVPHHCNHKKEEVVKGVDMLKEKYIPFEQYRFDAVSVFLDYYGDDIIMLNSVKRVDKKCYDRFRRYVYSKVVRYKSELFSNCPVHNRRKCRICRRRLSRRGDYLSLQSHMFQMVDHRNNIYYEMYDIFRFPETRTFFMHTLMRGLMRFMECKVKNRRLYHMCKCGFKKMMDRFKPYFFSEVLHRTRCMSNVIYNDKTLNVIKDMLKNYTVFKKSYGITVSHPRELNMFVHENVKTIRERLLKSYYEFKGSKHVSGVYCCCKEQYKDYRRPLDLYNIYNSTWQFFMKIPKRELLNEDLIMAGKDYDGSQSFFYCGFEIDEENSPLFLTDENLEVEGRNIMNGMVFGDVCILDGALYTLDELMNETFISK